MTVISQAEAISEMTIMARTHDATIVIPGKPRSGGAPSVTSEWARLSFQHAPSGQASLAGVSGSRKFRTIGAILIECHYPVGNVRGAWEYAEAFAAIYEGVSTNTGIWFRDVGVVENSDSASGWFRLDVVGTFEYDRLK